jgi:hypothetical protein
MNGAIDVTFSSEMEEGAWPVFLQQACDKCSVSYVALHKFAVTRLQERGDRRCIPGIGELVQHDNGLD